MDANEFYVENTELNDVEAWDGETSAPDAGEYEVRVLDDGLSRETSSRKQIPLLVVQSEIIRNADGSDTTMKGRRTFARYPEKGKGISRLKAFLTATGVKINARGGYNAAEAIGRHYLVSVHKEEYSTFDVEGNEERKLGTRVGRERALPGGPGNGATPEKTTTKPAPMRQGTARSTASR